jgi:NADH-quinone oxidoreductase subunit L
MHGTDELDIRKMGGLRKAMPMTAFLFSLGALSLGGIPILSGFWSKDEILLAVNDHLNKSFIVLALFTAFLSAMYMARAMFVPFFGKLGQDMDHAHESPMLMIVPMALLGIFAAFFGFVAFNWPGSYEGIGSFIFFHEAEGFHFNWWLGIVSMILAVGAFVLGYLIYLKGRISLEGFHSRMGSLVRVAENKYYFDEVYQWMVDHVVMLLANFIGLFDRVVVNDLAVNGPANTVRRLGILMRLHVTGHVYSYALGMVVGTIALSLFWWYRSVS